MSNPQTLGGLILASLMVLVGCAVLIWAIRRIWFARRSRKWPHADAVIECSEVCEDADSDNTVWFAPYVKYSFRALDREITGTALNFGFVNERYPSRCEAQQRADKFPVGAAVRVVHHPERPEQCVLEPNLHLGVYFVLAIGVGLGALGVWFLVEKTSM